VPDIAAEAITLSFGSGASRVVAIRETSIKFSPGSLSIVAGPSGSGKTSLLSVLGALVTPDAGSVRFGTESIFDLDSEQRTAFRRSHVGYVFQSFRLMRALSAKDNILLSLEIRRTADAERCCNESLSIVGLQSKGHFTPLQMSGGEQQRVAVARAIAHGPSIVLADEPTANLDSENGLNIARLLRHIAHEQNRIVAVVSHDSRIFPLADRLIHVEDGRVVGDELCKAVESNNTLPQL
jgi:putative ABC transport system ATP-binding protein